MRIIVIIMYLSLYPAMSFSQKGNVKIAGKIYYTTSHLYDTVSNSIFTETSILFFGNGESLFRSYDYLQGIEAIKKKQTAGQPASGMIFTRGTTSRYYANTANKELYRVQTNGIVSVNLPAQNYIMPEKIEKPNWQITTETKKIAGYICQKANGMCRGRYYTVWFSADIPYPFGPWKLNGLPGLIMEAEDSHHQVVFKFNRIEFPFDGTEYIEPVTNAMVTTEKDFERMRETPFSARSTPPPGITVSGSAKDGQGKPVVLQNNKNFMNNPMDLISKLPRLNMQ